jgi:hypothetical protein
MDEYQEAYAKYQQLMDELRQLQHDTNAGLRPLDQGALDQMKQLLADAQAEYRSYEAAMEVLREDRLAAERQTKKTGAILAGAAGVAALAIGGPAALGSAVVFGAVIYGCKKLGLGSTSLMDENGDIWQAGEPWVRRHEY